MTQTIEESEIEDESRSRAEERLRAREEFRREALKTLAGAIVGLVILVLGLVFESLWSILLIPVGALVLATAIFGGLGQGAVDVFSFRSRTRRLLAEESDKERARREQEQD